MNIRKVIKPVSGQLLQDVRACMRQVYWHNSDSYVLLGFSLELSVTKVSKLPLNTSYKEITKQREACNLIQIIRLQASEIMIVPRL
jgi:hypothetical protein